MRRFLAPVVLPVLALLALAPLAAAAGVTTRVVGGTTATTADAPWQALVLPGGYLCGGAILDATHVATAAHCVYDEDTLQTIAPGLVSVRAGIVDRAAGGGQTRAVAAVHVNPAYDPGLQTGDAAILTLASPLALDATVAAIPLTDVGWRPVDGVTSLRLSGWGSTAARDPYAALDGVTAARYLQVAKTLKSSTACAQVYSPFSDAKLICAGQAGMDACQGDSGGPLAVLDNGVWKLAGLVTGGAGCAWAGYPGYYARVSEPSLNAFLTARGAGDDLEQPVFTRAPAVSGTAQPGQTLTCDPGAFAHAYTADVAFVTGGAELASGTTLTLTDAHVGATLQCRVTAYGLAGTAEAVSAAVTVTAAQRPAPIAPTPPPPTVRPSAPADTAAPTVKVVKARCARKVCTIDVRVDDPSPSAGVKGVEAKVRTAYRTVCKVDGKRRGCTRSRSKRLVAIHTTTSQGYRVTTPKLGKGTHTFTLTAVDAAGHRQASPTTVKKTTR